MLEKYYVDLELPELPLANLQAIYNSPWKNIGYTIEFSPEKVLSKELLNTFTNLGVNPGYLVYFTNSQSGNNSNRYLHRDLVTKEDPRKVKTLAGATWKSACFGINFEVYPNENLFHWYSEKLLATGKLPETNDSTPLFRAWLAGVHFENTLNIPPVETKAILTKPVLVRTDVPHRTTFDVSPGSSRRLGVSIRFYEDWSWQDALRIFAPVFQK